MTIKIPLRDVVSSTLAAIGYDPMRQILAIKFKSKGQIRHYAGVPASIFYGIQNAASAGAFFNGEIKGKYQVEPMTGDCPTCGDHGWIGETCADCGCAEYVAKPMPILHYVRHDHPTALSQKLQRAICGALVDAKDVARVVQPTCPECVAQRQRDEDNPEPF